MRRLLWLLLVCLCLSGCAGQPEAPAPSYAPLPTPSAAPADEYPPVPIYLDGLLRLRGLRVEDTLYLCPAEVCALFSLEAESRLDEDGFRLILPQWTLEAPPDAEVYTVDGRFLYCPKGYRSVGERVYLPADAVCRLFSLSFEDRGDAALLDDSGFHLLRGGADYYAEHFSPDDLFWLSHIIYAEARWEPLAGQIGVGNVVLNRVENEQFPDTVMTVVLDREHVIQFDPVGTGDVAAAPDEQAILAACLCLEGYNTVGESLFFVNPDRGDATWFDAELTPTVTIGNHAFYTILN